ncbi:hypothetical protein [Actinomadura miaoliensis]|uniref:Uncharacterized protein n=1 Tax=Actinomadura miaoliensis TaxID=430685 RepID=A0ABP7WS25_9ACTN
MALQAGTVHADSGMSKEIYDLLDRLLSPPLQKAVDDATGEAKVKAQQALDAARDGWRKLAFAVARGVIGHIVANMEVAGVQTKGDVAASVSGSTGPAPPGPHPHTVALTATQSGVTFVQSNDGTGRVR